MNGTLSGASNHFGGGSIDESDTLKSPHRQAKMKDFIQWITDLNKEYAKGRLNELNDLFKHFNRLEKAMEAEGLEKTNTYYMLQSIIVMYAKRIEGIEK
jgi:hypothetical protein